MASKIERLMALWNRLIDFLSPWCPSGFNHRASIDVVTNAYGHRYCWHRQCIKANFAEVEFFDRWNEESEDGK